MEVADEESQIRAARNLVMEGGDVIQLGDFNLASRIAHQFSQVDNGAHLASATSSSGRKRKVIHHSLKL